MKLFVIQLLLAIFTSSQGACFLKKNVTNKIAKIKSIPSIDGQWPFLASFISIPEREFLKNRTYIYDDEHYICTGAIVSHRWVLTSYQCIFPLLKMGNYTTVFTGSTKPLSGNSHALEHYRLPVNLLPYITYTVDLTLLELDESIFTDNVTRSIAISSKMDFEKNDNLTIVGYSWYRDINDTSTFHETKHSPISFLSFGNCKNEGSKRLMCVGGDIDEKSDDKNVKYQANDASLIISEMNGKYMLHGMVVGSANSTDGFKAVATFLPSWCNWIRRTTRDEVSCK